MPASPAAPPVDMAQSCPPMELGGADDPQKGSGGPFPHTVSLGPTDGLAVPFKELVDPDDDHSSASGHENSAGAPLASTRAGSRAVALIHKVVSSWAWYALIGSSALLAVILDYIARTVDVHPEPAPWSDGERGADLTPYKPTETFGLALGWTLVALWSLDTALALAARVLGTGLPPARAGARRPGSPSGAPATTPQERQDIALGDWLFVLDLLAMLPLTVWLAVSAGHSGYCRWAAVGPFNCEPEGMFTITEMGPSVMVRVRGYYAYSMVICVLPVLKFVAATARRWHVLALKDPSGRDKRQPRRLARRSMLRMGGLLVVVALVLLQVSAQVPFITFPDPMVHTAAALSTVCQLSISNGEFVFQNATAELRVQTRGQLRADNEVDASMLLCLLRVKLTVEQLQMAFDASQQFVQPFLVVGIEHISTAQVIPVVPPDGADYSGAVRIQPDVSGVGLVPEGAGLNDRLEHQNVNLVVATNGYFQGTVTLALINKLVMLALATLLFGLVSWEWHRSFTRPFTELYTGIVAAGVLLNEQSVGVNDAAALALDRELPGVTEAVRLLLGMVRALVQAANSGHRTFMDELMRSAKDRGRDEPFRQWLGAIASDLQWDATAVGRTGRGSGSDSGGRRLAKLKLYESERLRGKTGSRVRLIGPQVASRPPGLASKSEQRRLSGKRRHVARLGDGEDATADGPAGGGAFRSKTADGEDPAASWRTDLMRTTPISESEAAWGEPATLHFNALAVPDDKLSEVAIQIFRLVGVEYDLAPDHEVCEFVQKVFEQYHDHPYHNCRHGLDVASSVAAFIRMSPHLATLPVDERLAIVVAALGHDVGHRGVSNKFLVDTADPLALTYNDDAVQEQMHTSLLFRVLHENPGCNLLASLGPGGYKKARESIIAMIRCTDMAKHFELQSNIPTVRTRAQSASNSAGSDGSGGEDGEDVDPDDSTYGVGGMSRDARLRMACSLLHAADIGSSLKPYAIARPWADRIFEEFLLQGDREAALGMTPAPMMDRTKAVPSDVQLGFIEFFVVPFMSRLVTAVPSLSHAVEHLACNVREWSNELAAIKADAGDEAGMQDAHKRGKAMLSQLRQAKRGPGSRNGSRGGTSGGLQPRRSANSSITNLSREKTRHRRVSFASKEVTKARRKTDTSGADVPEVVLRPRQRSSVRFASEVDPGACNTAGATEPGSTEWQCTSVEVASPARAPSHAAPSELGSVPEHM
ncbi:unnamed protein product [Pedinophyceae sp. YPF-701]|nr:unnamed protein product [Pedinophyceae sp. YPF-701]